jgi:uncharacterized membrane protein
MNITLWIVSILLAFAFGMAGITKATSPKEKLAPKMSWVNDYSANAVKAIGVAEFLGAVGLILPWATGILKWLTPLAAVGLAIIMVLAIAYHVRKKEFQVLPFNAILLALSLFVAIGRF